MDNKIYQNKNSGDITDSQKNQSQTAEKSIQKTSAEVEKKPQKHSAEVGKSPQKHSAEIEKKRPKKNGPFKRAFLTALAVVLFRALCVFMRAKTDGKKLAKSIAEPCVLLSTHGSVFDAAYAGRAIVPKYYTGVVAKRLFYLPFLGKVLSYAEFIQKKQFVVDIGCIKQIKSGIDGGASVFICPEGKTSVVGRNSYLSPSIAKLIKWIGAPVLFYRAKGSYLSFPRFGKIRKGKILVESELLFGKDEIKNLSTDAIFERLNEAFQYNDHEYQEKNRIKFKCKAPAEGLELLLYKCPKCGAEFKNSSKKDEIFCSECGNTVKIDLYGKIVPIDISGERGVGKKEIISKTDENSNEKAVSNADGNSNEKIVSKIEANPNKIVSNSEIISNRSVAFDRIDRWVDFQKYALTAEILEKRNAKNSVEKQTDDGGSKFAEIEKQTADKSIEKVFDGCNEKQTDDGSEFTEIEKQTADKSIEKVFDGCNDGFKLVEEVVLSLEDPSSIKYIKTAKGRLVLSENGIEFFPSEIFDENAKADYFYPINTLPTVAFSKKSMTLGRDNAIQSYEFLQSATLYKWNFAVEILYEMNEKK